MTKIISCILACVAAYCLTAFVTWEYDPGAWTWVVRLLTAALAYCLVAAVVLSEFEGNGNDKIK